MAEPAYPLAFPGESDERVWPEQGSWTYEDYARLPEDGRRYEVIRGFLYVTPAPSLEHQFCVTQLSRRFGNFVARRRLGMVLVAPFDVRLPDSIASPVQPDILFFRNGNLPRPGGQGFDGVPDLVVEVLSPGTRSYDERVKLAAYRDAGVPEVWMPDWKRRTVTVYRLDQDRKKYAVLERAGAGEKVGSAVLAGLRVPVDGIFLRQR